MDSDNLTTTEESNKTSTIYLPTHKGFVLYAKYVYLVITAIALIGTAILLFVITVHRRRTRLPVTTSSALCVLLGSNVVFLMLSFSCLVFQVNHKRMKHLENDSALSCQIFRILYWTTLTLQGYAQCVVSIERAVAIVKPLRVKRIITKRRMFIVLLSLILIILATQIIHLHYGYITYPGGCFRRIDRVGKIIYIVINSIIRGGIPLIVLLICSFLIIYSFTKSRRTLAGESQRRRAQELRLGAVLLTIDIIFLISTMPHLIIMTTLTINLRLYGSLNKLVLVTTNLREMGAVTDWLVLLCLGRHVRGVFWQAICGCRQFRQPASQTTVFSTERQTIVSS